MENLSLGFKVLIEEVRWEIKKILQHTKNSLYSVFLRYETINCSRAMDQTHNGTQGVVKKVWNNWSEVRGAGREIEIRTQWGNEWEKMAQFMKNKNLFSRRNYSDYRITANGTNFE